MSSEYQLYTQWNVLIMIFMMQEGIHRTFTAGTLYRLSLRHTHAHNRTIYAN